MKPGEDAVRRVLDWLGVSWSEGQLETLQRYAAWLVTEGRALGGIGPDESARLWDRHLADSLVFGVGFSGVGSVLDVGSGVGLPGIPLAICFPDARVTLLDRRGRRTDALRRVAAILAIDVTIETADISDHFGPRYERIVLRASLPVEEAARRLRPLLVRGGELVVGLGRGEHPATLTAAQALVVDPPEGSRVITVRTPAGILDSPAWLLRMTAE